MRTQKKRNPASIEKLIETEWDIINDLKKMLMNPELSAVERIRTSNALGARYPDLGNPTSPNSYIEDIEKASTHQLKDTYYAGLDLGKQVDYSVLAVIQKTEKEVRLVHKRQFPLGTPYPDIIAYVSRAHQVFNFEGLYVDKTGIGDAVVDELEAIEVPNVKGIFLTDTEKENILNYLKLLMEKHQLKILGDDEQLVAQINQQQYEYLKPKTAQERIYLKFRHPLGRHDDQLYALALACYASKQTESTSKLWIIPK